MLAFRVSAMYYLPLTLHFRGRHHNCHPNIKLRSPSYITAVDCLISHNYKKLKMYPNTFCFINFFAHGTTSFKVAVRDSPPCLLIPHLDLISVQGLNLSYGTPFSLFNNLKSSKTLETFTSTTCVSALLCPSMLLKRGRRPSEGAERKNRSTAHLLLWQDPTADPPHPC